MQSLAGLCGLQLCYLGYLPVCSTRKCCDSGFGKRLRITHRATWASVVQGRSAFPRAEVRGFCLCTNCIKPDHICYFQEYSGAGRRPR